MGHEPREPDAIVAMHADVLSHPNPEVQQALWECLVALRKQDYTRQCDESELARFLSAACDRFDGEGRNQLLTWQEVRLAGITRVLSAHEYICNLSELERERVLAALAAKLREFGQRWRVRSPAPSTTHFEFDSGRM